MKKLAMALAASEQAGMEFEGFQGSGDGFPGPLNRDEQFGRYVSATQIFRHTESQRTDSSRAGDDDAADLDGGLYIRSSKSNSNGGSDSRSRTSDSLSRPRSQLPIHPSATPPVIRKPSSSSSNSPKPKSKKSSKSRSSASQSTTQSPSLASPISTRGRDVEEIHFAPTPTDDGPSPFAPSPPPVAKSLVDLQPSPKQNLNSVFPSAGFAVGPRGKGSSRVGDMGAFLARRGE